MINYDSIFNLSSGVTCNWCIQLDALESLALNKGINFVFNLFQHSQE